MIVRILGEGQYDVSDAALGRLNELDSTLEAAVSSSDEAGFRTALTALLDGVRTAGVPHDVEAIDPSDLILPNGDADMAEVAEMLSEDGLIPG